MSALRHWFSMPCGGERTRLSALARIGMLWLA